MTLRNAFASMGTESTSDKILFALSKILTRLPFQTPAGEMRASITSGTLPTVTTLTNITSAGGLRMDLSQMAAINASVAIKRRNIIVAQETSR